MSLKYPFREVFRRKILRPKRLWAVLEELDARLTDATGSDTGFASDILALKNAVGDASSGLVKKANDLETTVGDASSGLVKKANDLETTVGSLSNYDDTVLAGKVTALETTIGDEETANSILARIKALEDAQ